MKILNDPQVPNTDGIDPDASCHVKIDHCFAYCSDDNIAVKSTNNLSLLQDVNHITVKNCTFLTRKSALKVGSETRAGIMKNIRFENNDIIECDRALVLYCYDGALFRNITFINNRVERNFPDSQRKAIHFTVTQRFGTGNIKNVFIKNCVFYHRFPNKSAMTGLDEKHDIENIRIKNLMIEGKKIHNFDDLDLITDHVKRLVIK